MHDEEHGGFQPQLIFDRDSREFVLGFEAGDVWNAAERDLDDEFVQTVHTENAEMVLRIAEATGRTVISEELGHGWMHCTFSASDPEIRPDWLNEVA